MPQRTGLRLRLFAFGGMSLLALVAGMRQSVSAEDAAPGVKVDVVAPGSSHAAARKQALSDVPLDHVSADFRPQVEDLVKNISLFRRMPTLKFVSDPDVYGYFLAQPDMAVSIWRAMEISNFELSQAGPSRFEADSRDGSVGVVEVLHSSKDRQLVLCEGAFKSPLLLKPIKARALLHLQPAFTKSEDGQPIVTHTLDLFVSFPSQPVDITAKLLSPVSHAMADRNFRDVTLWCAMMHVAMSQQPGWVEQMANKLDVVPPARRDQFLKLAAQTYVTARKRAVEQQTGSRSVSIEQVLSTLKQSAADGSKAIEKATLQVSGEQSANPMIENANGKR